MIVPHLITPPEPPFTATEVKAHTRIDHDADDDLIDVAISAAVSHLDGWNGILTRALEPQTWELALDAFPTNEIGLLLGPLVSVESVRYIDADGAEQTVSSTDYVVDTNGFEGWVVPVSGFSWPSTMATINAVRVRWVCGTGTPASIKMALYILTTYFYDNREGGMPDILPLVLPWRRITI